MPILHRYIGSPQHAGAADNGKPVFRGNAPSRQAAMQFGLEFVGGLDLSILLTDVLDGFNPAGFPSLTFSDAEINTALAAYDGDYDKYSQYYNQAAYDNLSFNMTRSYTWRDANNSPVKGVHRFATKGGLVWNAADWHWKARLRIVLNLYYFGTVRHMEFAEVMYESSPSAQSIRLGNGINLAYSGVVDTGGTGWDFYAGTADTAAIFGGTSLILSATYGE